MLELNTQTICVDRGHGTQPVLKKSVKHVVIHSDVWIPTQEWLSERFMLPESQRSNFAEMKRTFINPALKKINADTPLKPR